MKQEVNRNALKSGRCVYEQYDRSPQGEIIRANFEARDKYDMCQLLARNMGLYIYEDQFEEQELPATVEEQLEEGIYYLPDNAPQEVRDQVAEYVLGEIISSNGDGCDIIMSLTFDGEELISEESSLFEEVEWGLV